ncbi:MAG: hypothetical protein Tsb009_08200 [Planctomycetaceae bacterium]
MPQREPLTPELVEDEALRGDFMLRWALVLLAFLLGCTEISETETLVHIKSGQYILENGIPGTNVFSSSAAERPWRNLSWLFDVVLAGIYNIGGAIGLSIFKAILAAVIFWVIANTTRKNVSTWWGTICGALALLVCYPRLSPQPEILTFLGLGLTLFFLHRWREEDDRKYLRNLLILFVLWANMDPHMFFGLAIVLLYAVGEWVGNWLGMSNGLQGSTQRKTLWTTVGLCFVASLLNPWGWHSLLSAVSLYGSEYPALRDLHPNMAVLSNISYYPMTTRQFWTSINHNSIAGLVLLLAAFVTFGLNYRRLDFGHLFVGLGFTVFAILTIHELPAAAIVASVLATLNAQQWYQHTFRQTYSVQTSELVFSRGGRAITVLALFGLAYLAISGRLYLLDKQGVRSRRTGVGMDANLQASIDGLQEQLKDSYDDRPFNFIPKQGDLLIWIGKKAFIDSRISAYVGNSDENLVPVFMDTRNALQLSNQPGDAGLKWKPTLDRFQITHVIPRLDYRLTGSFPDFTTFEGLYTSRHWQLVNFGSTTAVFYRTDLSEKDPQLATFLAEHRQDFPAEAFRSEYETPEPRTEWPRLPSFTEKYLSLPKKQTSNEIQVAENYSGLAALVSAGALPDSQRTVAEREKILVALSYLIIRNAHAGLLKNPQNQKGYTLLGSAYQKLSQLEVNMVSRSQSLQENPSGWKQSLLRRSIGAIRVHRLRQALCAFRQALVLDPDNLFIWRTLADLYLARGMDDYSMNARKKCMELAKALPIPPDASEAVRQAMTKARKFDAEQYARLQESTQGIYKAIAATSSEMTFSSGGRQQRMRGVNALIQRKCQRRALELLEEDPEILKSNVNAAFIYVSILLEAGFLKKSYEKYNEYISEYEPLQADPGWRLLGGNLDLCRGDYARARATWMRRARDAETNSALKLAETFPLATRSYSRASAQARVPTVIANANQQQNLPFTQHIIATRDVLLYEPYATANHFLIAAFCDLEAGRNQEAAKIMQQSLEMAPDSPLRSLLSVYLEMLTGKPIPKLARLPKTNTSPKNKNTTPNGDQ